MTGCLTRCGESPVKDGAESVVEGLVGLYRDRYFDLNVRHFHEKLRDQPEIELIYKWMKLALQGARLVAGVPT